MSVLDKFLNVMRLNPDDDDDFYNEDYDYDDDYEEDETVKPKSSFRKDKKKAEEDDYEEDHSIRQEFSEGHTDSPGQEAGRKRHGSMCHQTNLSGRCQRNYRDAS